MDVHLTLLSALSADATTSILWNHGFHVHVVDDSVQMAVRRERNKVIRLYVCTLSPLTIHFIRALNYHAYAVGILYDSTSRISRARAKVWHDAQRARRSAPSISFISAGARYRRVSDWVSAVCTSLL